jgi:hypothetical protein
VISTLIIPADSFAAHWVYCVCGTVVSGIVRKCLALRPPHGDSLAALIQTAREAETVTVEVLDTTGITGQLKQMQAQISKISILIGTIMEHSFLHFS